MTVLTIAWITLSLFVGLTIYLLPKLDRYLAFGMVLLSGGYGVQVLLDQTLREIVLLDHFGVTLLLDQLSGYFILTNALVTAAVLGYCIFQQKSAFFYSQAIILHGSINAVFICADFMSLYVALEVIGIAAFLLVSYPKTNRSIWVALRYLFISNTAMLFYLVGAVLVYQANNSFAFTGLINSPPEAIALIFLGLLTKGGIFLSGLWLPLTHSESETPVSAMLSGVVVKTGVFPLLRCGLLMEELTPTLQLLGMATAFFGVIYALFEKDSKRILASSTISQLGWLMVAPAAAGMYALGHGVVKSLLFLMSGSLPSRNLDELQEKPMHTSLWIPLILGSLSMSGCPLWMGFSAKALTLKSLGSWQEIVMNVASVGTALIFAKFIFLPHKRQGEGIKPGLKWVASFLICALLLGNVFYWPAYTLPNMLKALGAIAVAWLAYFVMVKPLKFQLPRVLEQFEHLIGVMCALLFLLSWTVFA
jgi:multicomponent Na+:H+ antiporter subunit D